MSKLSDFCNLEKPWGDSLSNWVDNNVEILAVEPIKSGYGEGYILFINPLDVNRDTDEPIACISSHQVIKTRCEELLVAAEKGDTVFPVLARIKWHQGKRYKYVELTDPE